LEDQPHSNNLITNTLDTITYDYAEHCASETVTDTSGTITDLLWNEFSTYDDIILETARAATSPGATCAATTR
jgi:hypothetical protein